MTKVVINKCYGGFGLSPNALQWLFDHGYTEHATKVEDYWRGYFDDDSVLGKNHALQEWRKYATGEKVSTVFLTVFTPDEQYVLNARRGIPRDLPLLIEVVELMQEKASSSLAKLEIVEVPDDVEWEVEEYDGMEWIAEKHRVWS